MTDILKRALELEAQASAHEATVAWLLEQAQDARDWARIYRGLHDALEVDDFAAARDFAYQLGLGLEVTRDGILVVAEDNLSEVGRDDMAAVAAARRER